MRDGCGRTINYARISVTDRCNLRCLYCMPPEGAQIKTHEDILRLEEIIAVTRVLVGMGINKIRLTGGEPLVRKGFLYLVEEIGKLPEIKDFALTTNGLLLPDYAASLQRMGLHRVNISLDTLREQKYRTITSGGSVAGVLDGMRTALREGLGVKLNTVLIKGFNTDEIEELVHMTMEYAIDVRFIELMAIGARADWARGKYIDAGIVTDTVRSLVPVSHDDASSPAVYYQLPGAKGRIGLIRAVSHKFCGACNRIRITADGRIKSCLHSDQEVDIKDKTGNEQLLRQAITDAVNAKPFSHELAKGKAIMRNMTGIGG